jgi:LysR family cyn operon transcriptional activator
MRYTHARGCDPFVDLTLARSFITVVDAGTISDAAVELVISQSALSRRLQQLEADLGADLLVRGRHGVELTDAGHEVLAESRHLVERYDLLRRRLDERRALERGTVRVGGGATVTSFLLPERIGAFQAAHPGVRFQVKEAGSQEVADDVAHGRLDLGMVTTPIAADGLELRDHRRDEIVLVARPDHPLARRRSVRAADLDGLPIVAFEPGSAIRQLIDGALGAAGLRVDVVMELRSIPTMLRMVATTGNLAFVSRVSLADQPGLRAIDVRGFELHRQLALAVRRGVALSPAAAAFAATLAEAASGLEPPGR